MSQLFYDSLIKFEKLEQELSKVDKELSMEIWEVVDQIIHYSTLDFILGKISEEDRIEFMEAFTKAPHDPLILDFINQRVDFKFEDELRKHFERLEEEILNLMV